MNGETSLAAKYGGQMPTARDVAAVLFRQRVIVVCAFLVVFAAIILYGICFPSYRAEMKLLVGKGRADPPVVPQPTAFDYSRYDVSEEEINSEVQLLQDVDVLRPVVIKTGLSSGGRAPWVHGGDESEARVTRAVRRLATRLEVTPIRKTRLISVAYESADPGTAARVLRELSSVYLEKHLATHRPAGESAFFQQQTETYGKALGDAERNLLTEVREKGTNSPSVLGDLVLQKLAEADAYARQVTLQKSETENRIQALKHQLAELPERRTTEVRTGDNPELLQQLKSTLLNLELKRVELLTKYQPSYRLVQEVEQQIADTRTAIAAESLAPVHQETTDNEPRYDWATSELKKAEIEFNTLQVRESGAVGNMHAYQQMAARLGEQAIQHEDLMRHAKIAEENYLLYVRKREEARIGDALDEQRILNVAVVQEPVVPALPKWSLPGVIVFSLLCALVLSIGVGFAADYLDPSYRTPEELTISLGVPTLASLPHEAA
ncbi:MAG TPA: hypothetical protein VMT53_14110 [Terriglobales bacterium]|nr:hypothetical protein [Terriglobales bacterium]